MVAGWGMMGVDWGMMGVDWGMMGVDWGMVVGIGWGMFELLGDTLAFVVFILLSLH